MIPAVILAAGFSTRMGRDKALLEVPGDGSFLSRLARTFVSAGCSRVIAVVGARSVERITAVVDREALPVTLVLNPDPARGQLSSLREAIVALERGTPRGILVCPVDQPLVAAQTVALLLDAWSRTRALIVRPSREGRHGHPVVFDARILPELMAADLGGGARPVVRAHAAETVDVEVEDPGAFEDVDTPEDYRRVFGTDARTT
jgi:molybdenum cofactor cytidylyltransferase